MKILSDSLCIGVINVRFANGMIVSLIPEIIAFGADMPTEVFVIVATVATIMSEAVVPALYGSGVRAGMMIEVLTGTPVLAELFEGTNVLAGADANVRAATMVAFRSVPMLTSSEDALAFGSGASSCWPATA